MVVARRENKVGRNGYYEALAFYAAESLLQASPSSACVMGIDGRADAMIAICIEATAELMTLVPLI